MKILIVEDNIKLAESIKKGFEQESYAVDVINDGDAALRRIITHPKDHDLIILDIMLPGKTGLEICKQIRQEKNATPVLMLTAKDTTPDKITGLDTGADDYLIKPFSFEELLARVRALLRRPKDQLPDNISVHGISLNSNTKDLRIDGRPVVLTLREFSLLEYLMRNANHILSKDQIMAHVWEHSYDIMSNVVEAHIKNIRKKLGTNGRYLQTIRGMGYRFSA